MPDLPQHRVIHAIACPHITVEPPLFVGCYILIFWQRVGHPRQFAHQFKHHRIVFRALHGVAPSAQMLAGALQWRVRSGCQPEVMDELVHASVKSHIGSEVLQHTEQPRMIAVALVATPHRWCSEHRTALREEIQHHQVLSRQAVGHRGAWVLGPALHHPHSLRVDTFHGGEQLAPAGRIVDGIVVGTLVERIHRVVACLAVEPCQLLVVKVSNAVKGRVGSDEICRTRIAVPLTAIGHADAQLCPGIVWQHAAVARQHGAHAQRSLALQDAFLQSLLLTVPVVGQRSAPPFKIVHRPPGQKSRTGDEASYLFFGIA